MSAKQGVAIENRKIGRIPVRNLWLLMLYASDLTRIKEVFNALVEDDLEDIPDLVAKLLAHAVEQRLRRNVTRGYQHRAQSLTRVRGRIDILRTEAQQLLSRGEVYCRFEELTTNTPRNRLVRAALDLLASLARDRDLARQCRSLAATLGRSGVAGVRPSRAELAQDQIGRNDHDDRLMVELAKLAFDLALPTEEAGPTTLVSPERGDVYVRRLFEKAVLGFARVELERIGWRVRGGTCMKWQVSAASDGAAEILPGMITDIIIDDLRAGRRLVIDTKFTSVLDANRFGGASLKSSFLYQMYTYLRSQEGLGLLWDGASGLFLHPAVDVRIRESVTIQGHAIAFATVDLGREASSIRTELRGILRSGLCFDTERS
ncbi:5-methylcytosine-specific restriction endonuclease system specificity protein McrC [Burkholderia multivorans]|uniref:5-methylcytosine-specific restriction enzyme subunit McrC n=1 Tax=Burkholderia multivorans TaxID=87883 RepID=A0ABD7LKS6_9BURK|nr:5-methylcytosine-specific restriction endonuclease system specificity protein McrC [Burkholderia multivorans]MBJ9617095.1 5-methylcytosine-specific restriction endonuclease system specificity protein McrC [Burkholderia multivorans]MBR8125697.1 5-methylcytosine-specific restriction endonuclease system specificity protein McrC [Burkholderia multivorans]MBU9329712.1 5-methylcytosine-specific restriction endonuclease system specificity protein McrC [Burkholderia multivorans]MBU9377168.1 5-methyl